MNNRPWIIWLTCVAVALIAVGIFFYYNMFRQSKSELIEAIPTDAAFILALNDNDGFVSGAKVLTPYLDELLVLDAMPAFQTIRKGLPAGEYDLTVSGHANNDGVSVLFNMHADKAAFKRLLRALSIDPNNHTTFEGARIYTYGTNFKSVKFTYVNHIITLSTDMELLKRAVVQYTHPKNLLSDKQFKEMYNLTEKNRKQNWLIVNPERYSAYLSSFLKENLSKKLSNCLKEAGWTALQLRFSGNEVFLSGFARQKETGSGNFLSLLGQQANVNGSDVAAHLFPCQANWYVHFTGTGKDMWSLMRKSFPHSSEKETSVLWTSISPKATGCFSLHADSCDYTYCVILPDSVSEDFLTAFYCGDTHKADSVRSAHLNGIYPIPHKMLPITPSIATDSMAWVTVWNNALVFSPTMESATFFTNNVKKYGNLTQNRYYPFVNEAVASSSLFNFVLFNDETAHSLQSQLSEKGQASRFGKGLRIFSLSCDAMEKNSHLVPINLYLLF
jgi:hypothetical protein